MYDQDKGFGFMRYFRHLPGQRVITSDEFVSAFFHASSVPDNAVLNKLPSRRLVFEFTLTESTKQEG